MLLWRGFNCSKLMRMHPLATQHLQVGVKLAIWKTARLEGLSPELRQGKFQDQKLPLSLKEGSAEDSKAFIRS